MLASIRDGGRLQVFYGSVWLWLLSCNVSCGDDFDGAACKIWLRAEGRCCGGVMWSFCEEETSFFNRSTYFSKSSFVVFLFSSSAFDVDQTADLGLP